MLNESGQTNGADHSANDAVISQESVKREVKSTPEEARNRLSLALQKLFDELRVDQAALSLAADNRRRALAFGIPLFSISLAVVAGKAPDFYRLIGLENVFTQKNGVFLLWLLAALVVLPVYYFIFHKKVAQGMEALTRSEESYVAMRLSTMDGRKEYFREQLFRLSSKASRVFFGDERRFNLASTFATNAGNALDEARGTADLSTAQSYLNSLSELVSREEREQKEERLWQYAAIAIMIIYVVALVLAARTDFGASNPQYRFGVPESVILWGAAGSLAAILYRFYTEQGQIRFATEFRWLIARPIIGIIMGGVVYIALSSGLVLLTTGGNPATASSAIHNEAFWIVAFLAGFSDKFYLGVIDLLVARTIKTEEVDQNTIVTRTERIPDNSKTQEAPNAPEEAAAAK